MLSETSSSLSSMARRWALDLSTVALASSCSNVLEYCSKFSCPPFHLYRRMSSSWNLRRHVNPSADPTRRNLPDVDNRRSVNADLYTKSSLSMEHELIMMTI